jgi:hypothetical protein
VAGVAVAALRSSAARGSCVEPQGASSRPAWGQRASALSSTGLQSAASAAAAALCAAAAASSPQALLRQLITPPTDSQAKVTLSTCSSPRGGASGRAPPGAATSMAGRLSMVRKMGTAEERASARAVRPGAVWPSCRRWWRWQWRQWQRRRWSGRVGRGRRRRPVRAAAARAAARQRAQRLLCATGKRQYASSGGQCPFGCSSAALNGGGSCGRCTPAVKTITCR